MVPKGKKMVSVYPIRYREGQLEFLLIKRATVSYNWQCVTGSVGDSMGALDHPKIESPLGCAHRELFEETGYTPAFIVPFDPPQDFYIEDEPAGQLIPPHLQKNLKEITFFNFIARIDQLQDPVLNPAEHTDWQWVQYERAYQLIMWAIEKKALRIIHTYLINNNLREG